MKTVHRIALPGGGRSMWYDREGRFSPVNETLESFPMPWHEDLDYGYDKEVARFERWLAEHDRQVAERVWWEACLRIATGENDLDIADIYQRQNPYLEGEANE